MKTVCIYHSIDLDGWMSAAIVKHWFLSQNVNNLSNYFVFNKDVENNPFGNRSAETLDMIGYNYGQPIPDLSEYDKIIMCDISFPKEDMLILASKLTTNLIWIDHHQRTINETNKYLIDYCKVEIEGLITEEGELQAACELTWKYFFPNETMPEIVRLLGMYDSFRHKGTSEEQKVLEFQYAFRQRINNYELAYEYLISEFDYDLIYMEGIAIYQFLCTEAKQTYKNGFEISLEEPLNIEMIERRKVIERDIQNTIAEKENKGETSEQIREYLINLPAENGGYLRKFICINKERFNPINFGIDYHKDGYDGCACFHYSGIDNKWHFSLYNDNGEVDVSIIAKQFGGGGHKGASGFVTNNLDLFKINN